MRGDRGYSDRSDDKGCGLCAIQGHAFFCGCPCHRERDPAVFGEPPELGSRLPGPWPIGYDVAYDHGVIGRISRRVWALEDWRLVARVNA
jgi:hypothetical protein